MAHLHSYRDGPSGCFANIRMDSGDPCFVSIAQTGVLVKKSKLGWFGATLYNEKEVDPVAVTAMALTYLYPNKVTPPGITNPVLNAFVNAILHCLTLPEVTLILNHAVRKAEEVSPSWQDELVERVATVMTPEEERLIQEYGATLQRSGERMVADVAELPAPKEQIRTILLKAIRLVPNQAMRQQLKVGYMELSSFQEGAKDGGNGIIAEGMSPIEVLKAIPPKELLEKVAAERERLVDELRRAGLWQA